MNILIVDDHPENVLALEGILRRHDYNLETVTSGADALWKVLKLEFAVILLDVVMPMMDGFETARLIRQRKASRDIPIIFLTANGADAGLIYRAYAIGAVDYLVKPIDPEIVRAKVAVFVDLFKKTVRIREQEAQLREIERQRSEAALRESEVLYQTTFNEAAIGIAHAGLDGRWVRANGRFSRITGYSEADLSTLRLNDIVHRADFDDVGAALSRMLSGGIDSYQRETRFLHRLGHVVWTNLTLSLLRDATGVPKHFIAVIEDFSDRKHAEERQRLLSETSDCLLSSLDARATLGKVAELLVPAIADCFILDVPCDGDTSDEIVVLHANDPSFEALSPIRSRLTRDARSEAVGVARSRRGELYSDLGDYTWSAEDDGIGLVLLHKLGFRSALIVPICARDDVLGTMMLASSTPGRRYGRQDLVFAEDLARRIALALDSAKLYRKAHDAVAARDEFLSIASHELRTPLTPLHIVLQSLLGDRSKDVLETLPEQRLRGMLTRCERQVQRLTSLVEGLLDVSRISAGPLQLEYEVLDMSDLTRDIVGRFAEELSRAECTIDLQVAASVVGMWDRFRIEQVITNLLTNALKYGPKKPIEITLQRADRNAYFRITDHGIGINADHVKRIFGRFERAVSPREYGGLGLGLYIARRIVEAHGGTIEVASEPGHGAAFSFQLPVEPPSLLAAKKERAADQPS